LTALSDTADRTADGSASTVPELRGPIGVAASTHRLTREYIESALAAAADIGLEARLVCPGDDQGGLGVLLAIGHQESLLPVLASPHVCPRIVWTGEPVVGAWGKGGGFLATVARSQALDLLSFLRPLRSAPLAGPLARLRSAATTERSGARSVRQLRDLVGTVDRLVVTSRDRQATLGDHGIVAHVVPFGYAPAVAGPLTPPDAMPRDLPMVFLGSTGSRAAVTRTLIRRWCDERADLTAARDIWGADRNALLRRARVILNVQRIAGDFIGTRLLLALAAGAAVVTDPMEDPHPFVPGIHYVEAPLENLLDEAGALLADEPRRRRIVQAGQALLANELSMTRSLARVLALLDAPASALPPRQGSNERTPSIT
jgi:hypothetical protein